MAVVLVNAAGLEAQLLFNNPARLVTAATVIVQLAVVTAMVTALMAMVSGAPCVTIDEPPQPAPNVTVGKAELKRSEAGSDSVNEIPDCAGLVPLLVNVNTRLVVAPSLIGEIDHALVNVGLTRPTTKH